MSTSLWTGTVISLVVMSLWMLRNVVTEDFINLYVTEQVRTRLSESNVTCLTLPNRVSLLSERVWRHIRRPWRHTYKQFGAHHGGAAEKILNFRSFQEPMKLILSEFLGEENDK